MSNTQSKTLTTWEKAQARKNLMINATQAGHARGVLAVAMENAGKYNLQIYKKGQNKMSTKKKILIVVGIIAFTQLIASACMTAFAGTFDGQYHITFTGEIRQNGMVVEEYETDNDFTVKGHRLYYGLTANKNHRVGKIYYTGKNKARINVSYFGQGKEVYRVKREKDGTWAGRFHGYFLGEEGERYTTRGTIYAEPINE